MLLKPGDAIYVPILFVDADRAPADADALPTAALYRNGTLDAEVTLTVTKKATGAYMVTGTLPATYAAGDWVAALVNGAIASVSLAAWVLTERLDDELHLAHQAVIGHRDHVVATGVDQVYDSDGETVLKVLTPTEVDGTVTLTPSDPA